MSAYFGKNLVEDMRQIEGKRNLTLAPESMTDLIEYVDSLKSSLQIAVEALDTAKMEAVGKFSVNLISEIDRVYSQGFCAADAVDIIKQEIIRWKLK